MVKITDYKDFVESVTSDESSNLESLIARLKELDNTVNIASLMTGAIGIASEGGEFNEIVKKCIFQGKPLDDAALLHLQKEMGDIMWYWMQCCIGLGVDPNDIIKMNIEKLEKRYPNGFSVFNSENRNFNDI